MDQATIRVGRCRLITEKALRKRLERKTEVTVDRAPYRADAARCAGNQNGICHVFSSCAFTCSKVRFLLSGREVRPRVEIVLQFAEPLQLLRNAPAVSDQSLERSQLPVTDRFESRGSDLNRWARSSQNSEKIPLRSTIGYAKCSSCV